MMTTTETIEGINEIIRLLESDETETLSYDEAIQTLKAARKIARQMHAAETWLGKGWLHRLLWDVLRDEMIRTG